MGDKIFLIGIVSFIFLVFLYNAYFDISGNIPRGRYCYDADYGISIYDAGRVVSDIGAFNDRCFDNLHEIREYFCTEGRYGGVYKVDSKVVNCGFNYRCQRDVIGEMDACVMS